MSPERRDDSGEQTDFDQRFAEIIASYGDTPSEPVEPVEEPAPPTPLNLDSLPSQWRVPSAGESSFVVDEGTYEPPAPAPLPKDVHFWSIIGCLVGGPLWLLYLFVFDRYARALWWVLACAACVAGIVLLVLRQPAERDEDDDDDGAVL